ncbi:hypothetical protein N0B16_03265 [Chryseobacterium sp. GMJ5]|uniref:YcxB-like protein domain-containing protein n=1 Tax=Chryseobacterium gilvum TaxID=2976534 RepID=A0ABT2VTX1_9FLAO|nr:hypothetical protein [Chryseobacterium gilvum]MCU7613447.1 hypothetical protein [Chryseobacterium gilvum]
MTNKKYLIFRRNYEDHISKKLVIEKEVFETDFYETRQPFGLVIFGFLMLLYTLYIIFEIHILYELFMIITALFFMYGGLKRSKLIFRISKNGIWSAEFGFIYFRHIERIEFYRYIGKHSSEQMKIYIKNYQLYQMEIPFLEQPISHIEHYGNLKNLLEHALKDTNKRDKNESY